ncbi:MAG TPA: (2Fe-2S)-binding protein [Chloroflexota bacterium]|nr:(2Fe-2S)-binding protein [Chloroflexota bacterium]
MVERTLIELRVNGETRTVAAPEHRSVLEILREDLNLTGTKHGCELGECGACTVLVDGKPMLSCLLLPGQAAGREIETIEGMAVDGKLHPLQKAFAEFGPVQCGYCIPGILLTAKELLARNADPSSGDIREALAGNLCRCTGYQKIVDAVQMAARDLRLEAAKLAPSPAAAGEGWGEGTQGAALPPGGGDTLSLTLSRKRARE